MINRRRLPNEYNVNKQVVIIKPGLSMCRRTEREISHQAQIFNTFSTTSKTIGRRTSEPEPSTPAGR